jgi:hypothetical protein
MPVAASAKDVLFRHRQLRDRSALGVSRRESRDHARSQRGRMRSLPDMQGSKHIRPDMFAATHSPGAWTALRFSDVSLTTALVWFAHPNQRPLLAGALKLIRAWDGWMLPSGGNPSCGTSGASQGNIITKRAWSILVCRNRDNTHFTALGCCERRCLAGAWSFRQRSCDWPFDAS